MKFATILALCLGAAIASPTPATHDDESPRLNGMAFLQTLSLVQTVCETSLLSWNDLCY